MSAPEKALPVGDSQHRRGSGPEQGKREMWYKYGKGKSKTNSLAVDLEVLVGIRDFLAVDEQVDGWMGR